MLRTLIIDGSRLFRAALAEGLAGHELVEVVAAEFSADRGIRRQSQGDIDLVLIDLQVSSGTGADYVTQWQALPTPRPIVIAMSATSKSGDAEVRTALLGGVSAFLAKSEAGIAPLLENLDRELARLGPRPDAAPSPKRTAEVRPESVSTIGEVVAIVSSTGGPEALQTIISGLSPDFAPPIVIVQHLPANFAKSLAANLTRRCGRAVQLADPGHVLQKGAVVLAPGPSHLEVHRDGPNLVCRSVPGPKDVGCKPSGNRLLRSVAVATNGRATAITLTGMGNDGTDGMREVARRGGSVIVQDEETSVVWGMPAAVLKAGVKALVLPLQRIAGTLNRRNGKAA
ncbi:MAG: response regulator [Nannocystaceae bacterium]|nr:response regulator [Nannocystaceae bacterium]